jgi:hypothetical protein
MVLRIIIFLLCISSTQLNAQKNLADSVAQKRNQMNQTNMVVLGSWAASNMLYAGMAISQNTGNEKHFHQMNVYWNVVNLGIAGFSYFNTQKQLNKSINLEQNVKEQRLIERVLLINSGLDVGYIATGIYLMNRSSSQNVLDNQYQMKGFGQSLVLQGGFLLLFDVYQYLVHRSNGKSLHPINSKASFSISGDKLSFVYRF